MTDRAPTAADSSRERLRKAKILVAAACTIFGIIAGGTLHEKAAGIAILGLVIFAFSWSSKSISSKKKLGFVLLVLILVAGINWSESGMQKKQSQEEAAQQNDIEKQAAQEADDAFKRMTPKEHLEAVRGDFVSGASETQLEDGNKNIEALKGTSLEKQGEALRARYYAQSERQAGRPVEPYARCQPERLSPDAGRQPVARRESAGEKAAGDVNGVRLEHGLRGVFASC